MSTCEHCDGQGRIAVGEYGGDCAAIHGMGGRMPDPPGWERCDKCDGTGYAEHTECDKHGEWTATLEGHQPGVDPIGKGDTREAAIADLWEQME